MNEVWVSGDGSTVFASDDGDHIYVVPASGGAAIQVTLPGQVVGFVSWPPAAQ